MKIYKVGETQLAACQNCESFQNATFKLRDVPFSDGSGLAKRVLVGVCDSCNSVILLPHQSTPAVNKQYEAKRRPVEGRLPAHLIDILNLASLEIGASTDFAPSIMKYYIHTLAENEDELIQIKEFLSDELSKGKADKRISLKGRLILKDINKLKDLTGIGNTTELLKLIILKIKDDVLVKKDSVHKKQLRLIMTAVA
ncbi:hypothetical protein [Glaciecola sp. KUL10]|uniref:hypothetical protein n=1 Tax=Glaciecola sp. (strain KUL10) TaxID=2161813 RepID=UPI000D788944|nr:hypothetical protein [Glaciecola sp. KUL10]GBL04873.1 hypothetical protein KUL10_21880 [Glaciecola sp. KUL10]